MKGWRCIACRASNKAEDAACEACGVARPQAPAGAVTGPARRCPIDGGPLGALSWCERGQGYPAGRDCPFACPLCRHTLTWDGRCFACHGTPTGERGDWTIPGDQYELDGGHWRKVEGPRECLPTAENRRHLAALVGELAARFAPPAPALEGPTAGARAGVSALDLGW